MKRGKEKGNYHFVFMYREGVQCTGIISGRTQNKKSQSIWGKQNINVMDLIGGKLSGD